MASSAENRQYERAAQAASGEVKRVFRKGADQLGDILAGRDFPENSRAEYEQGTRFLSEEGKELSARLDAIFDGLKWTTPYVAFYGETNVGKSTLIEALRLYCGGSSIGAGKEIGDGRSDYSRRSQLYPCELDGRKFTLIDVPGTEGRESEVTPEIEKALALAQIVFYVTANPQPPQGGEEGRDGTLEKMKRYLAGNANVWAIYNSKVKNPRGLKTPLVSHGSDTWQSLHSGPYSLDGKMSEGLGKCYRESLAVSARPAFLALLDGNADTDLLAEREKYAKSFSQSELLEASELEYLAELFRDGLPRGEQLAADNVRKLTLPIQNAREDLDGQAQELFGNKAAKLEDLVYRSGADLEKIKGDIARNARRLKDMVLDGVIGEVRREMGHAIDAGLDNDRFKSRLREVLDAKKVNLEAQVRAGMEHIIKNTKESIQAVLKDHAADLGDALSFEEDARFLKALTCEIDAQVNDGIDWGDVGIKVLLGAIGVIFTGAWGVAASLLWDVAGAVWGFLTGSSARKAAQKKKLSAGLAKVKAELSIGMEKGFRDFTRGLGEVPSNVLQSFEEQKEVLFDAVGIFADVSHALEKSIARLEEGRCEEPYHPFRQQRNESSAFRNLMMKHVFSWGKL